MNMTHPTMARVFERTGLEPSALALRINESPQTITNWSKRGVSKKGALSIAREFGFSVDWVLTGEEEQLLDRYMKVISSVPDQQQPEPYTRDFRLEPQSLELYTQQFLAPILDWDVTGEWDRSQVEEFTSKPFTLSEKGFALRVQGQSMAPIFNPKDLVYVETEVQIDDLKDSDFVVVKAIGGASAILRQIVIGESFEDRYLKVLNPNFADPGMVSLEGKYELIGKVIGNYIEFP